MRTESETVLRISALNALSIGAEVRTRAFRYHARVKDFAAQSIRDEDLLY